LWFGSSLAFPSLFHYLINRFNSKRPGFPFLL